MVCDGTCSSKTTFFPIEELAQVDGDVTLIFLSANGIHYTNPVDDDWYAAHQTTNDTFKVSAHPGVEHYYLSDNPASVLGCKEQYQNCKPNLPPERGCSPLGGLETLASSVAASKAHRDGALSWGLEFYVINDIMTALGSSALTARFGLSQGLQATLPASQWQREVENWNNIILASLQGSAVDKSVGPGNSEMLKYFWEKPSNDLEKQVCKNQVCKNSHTLITAIYFSRRKLVRQLCVLNT